MCVLLGFEGKIKTVQDNMHVFTHKAQEHTWLRVSEIQQLMNTKMSKTPKALPIKISLRTKLQTC